MLPFFVWKKIVKTHFHFFGKMAGLRSAINFTVFVNSLLSFRFFPTVRCSAILLFFDYFSFFLVKHFWYLDFHSSIHFDSASDFSARLWSAFLVWQRKEKKGFLFSKVFNSKSIHVSQSFFCFKNVTILSFFFNLYWVVLLFYIVRDIIS
jgi:hypothetical protein